MKKFLCAVLAIMLVAATFVPAMAAVNIKGFNPGDTLYVETKSGCGLNLRENADAKSTILCTVAYGTAVIATNTYSGSWLYVLVPGTTKTPAMYGWLSMNYLSVTQPGPKPTATATVKPTTTVKPTATPAPASSGTLVSKLDFSSYKLEKLLHIITPNPTVPGSRVNLRWAPSTDAAVITKLAPGAQLTVIAEGKLWYQVKTVEGYVGFIYKTYTATVYLGEAALYSAN